MLTPEQKAIRLTGIGGSEIGAIAGLNPWMQPIDVYRRKVEGYEEPDNAAMERGRFLERGTADWWAYRRLATLREVGTIVDPRNKLVVCTPDFLAKPSEGAELDLSIKVPGPRAWLDWGDDGTDQIPEAYLAQVQWELIALSELHGITTSEVAAPIGGDLRVYRVPADKELQGLLLTAAERFWRDHVLPRRPPEPDGSEGYAKHLRARFPGGSAVTVTASVQAEEWARRYFEAREQKVEAETRMELARQCLESEMGDATKMVGTDFRISWAVTKGRPSTDWEAVCEAAKVPKALVEQHTTRTPFRTFRPTSMKEASNG